jgi:transposase
MLNENFITKLLDLKDVKIKNLNVTETKVMIDIEYLMKPHKCPVCGYITSLIHDYRVQKIRDIPTQGKTTILNYRKRRYKCGACNKRFFEKQLLVPRYHQLTSRFAYYLLTLLNEKRSLTDIAKANNVSVTKLINLLSLVSFDKPKGLPRVLSIDEFKGNTNNRKFQCILTDPEHKKIVDILPGRESHIIIDYLKTFKDRNNVQFFVMDMNKAYLSIAQSFLPRAKIIVDIFHVARYNTWAFENVRKRVQKQLSPEYRKYFKRCRKLLLARMSSLSDEDKQAVNVMLGFSDDLTSAYLLKEKFYEFLDAEDYNDAINRLNLFLAHANHLELPEYSKCITMLNNWREYILNYFKYRFTNGFTEGMNNKIKVLKRIAFGFRSFINFRKRILLCSLKTG